MVDLGGGGGGGGVFALKRTPPFLFSEKNPLVRVLDQPLIAMWGKGESVHLGLGQCCYLF